MSISIDFGKWIREQRLSRGWSQERLANKVGLKGPSIMRYESGTQWPPLDVAEAIINVLGGKLELTDGL